MEFQVPQFIDTEDRIVGPFSLKHFVYVAVAAGLSFFLYFLLSGVLWFIFTGVIGGFVSGLIWWKPNGRPFERILMSAIRFYWQPQRYVWISEKTKGPKSQESLLETVGETVQGISLEKIISGFALKNAQMDVEVGSKNLRAETDRGTMRKNEEKYAVFEGIFGERRVAKRVDYR